MDQSNVIPISNPQESSTDALTALLRQGAKPRTGCSYGYLPERTIQAAIGSIQFKTPRIRDLGSQGIKFTFSLVPPYLRRSKT